MFLIKNWDLNLRLNFSNFSGIEPRPSRVSGVKTSKLLGVIFEIGRIPILMKFLSIMVENSSEPEVYGFKI